MVDLWWMDPKKQKDFQCSKCPTMKQKKMMCADDGFVNVPPKLLDIIQKRGESGHYTVDEYSRKYLFCPAKATWYPEISELFEHCRIAIETGLLPSEGGFTDQPALFVDVFPEFVERWNSRKYFRVWRDVIEFTPKVLEALGKMIGSMFGSK